MSPASESVAENLTRIPTKTQKNHQDDFARNLLVENDVPSGKLTTRWLEYPPFVYRKYIFNQSKGPFSSQLC